MVPESTFFVAIRPTAVVLVVDHTHLMLEGVWGHYVRAQLYQNKHICIVPILFALALTFFQTYAVMERGEVHYLLNKLFIEDYCVWIQKVGCVFAFFATGWNLRDWLGGSATMQEVHQGCPRWVGGGNRFRFVSAPAGVLRFDFGWK